jgi:hypothetical protein
MVAPCSRHTARVHIACCGGAGPFLFLGTIDGGTRRVGRTWYPVKWVTLAGSRLEGCCS